MHVIYITFSYRRDTIKSFVNIHTKRLLVKSKLFSTMIIAVFFLSACGSRQTVTPSPTETKTPIETEAVAEVQPEADECIACHTDKQRLIDTAAPIVEAEAESKGVG